MEKALIRGFMIALIVLLMTASVLAESTNQAISIRPRKTHAVCSWMSQ